MIQLQTIVFLFWQPVGCDFGIESGFTYDRCGVCNGDSTKCTQVMNTYTDDWPQNGK